MKKLKLSADKHAMRLLTALIILIFLMYPESWKNYGLALSRLSDPNAPLEYHDELAEYIRTHTSADEQVLVWGFRPIIYFVTEKDSPATYLPYPLSHVDSPLAERWASEFYLQITANPPVWIVNRIEDADRERIPDLDPEVQKKQKIKWKEVVLAHNYKETLEFIRQNYTRIDTIAGSDIYQLNSALHSTP